MNNETPEQIFRGIERRLDCALNTAAPQLNELGIAVRDASCRSYHYKNQFLSWEQSFTREHDVDLQVARAEVQLTYMEPIEAVQPPEVKVSCRSQLFRQAQESSKDLKHEQSISLENLLHIGLASFVLSHIEGGEGSLKNAP